MSLQYPTDNILMETDELGTTQAVYQNEPGQFGQLDSMRRNGQTTTYHYDAQGNTRELTDSTGNTTDTYTYDAFGNEIAKTGTTTNPYRFGGQHGYQYNAATDDYYIRARTYEPKQSRWTSKDPLRFIDGMNPYLYVGNRPTGANDPSGLATPANCKCRKREVVPIARNSPTSVFMRLQTVVENGNLRMSLLLLSVRI